MNGFAVMQNGMLNAYGSKVTIDGQTASAVIVEAELARVQQYLDADEWRLQPYLIDLRSDAIEKYNLHYGQEVIHDNTGWKSVVRKIFPPELMNGAVVVRILTVALPR